MNQHALYTAEQTRELDRLAIEQGISGYELMNRAGSSLLNNIRQQWPDARQLAIFCGAGNNAGDGYVLARLARHALSPRSPNRPGSEMKSCLSRNVRNGLSYEVEICNGHYRASPPKFVWTSREPRHLPDCLYARRDRKPGRSTAAC